MPHHGGLIRHAQCQIEKGSLFVASQQPLAIRTAALLQMGAVHHQQMPQVHAPGKQIRRPAGLQGRIDALARTIQVVLVRVNQVGPGLQCFRNVVKGVDV